MAGAALDEDVDRSSDRQPTIARLEDADYDGHSLGMLRRIAAALHVRLEMRLVPDRAA